MAVGSTGTLSSSSITVRAGESGEITWSGGAPQSIVSANTNIATVTKSGLNSGTITVTGVSVGNTTATIQWAEGTSTISITVAASDDTSFLNKRGLAYFWGKIDNKKQNKLTPGSNITISGDTISASQPTVNNGQLTIQKNGSNVQTFTANQSGNVTADIVTDELKRKSDTRSSMKPSDANFASSATLHFTTVGALDSQTQSGGYADALMLNSWSNDSGGRVNALVATKQNDQKLYHYTGTFNGSSWSGKKEVAYTDAIPTKVSDLTNDSGFVTSSGTVAKANQLTTARTIGISGGATGTATSFNGTANISIPITDVKDAYVTWGGKSIRGDITPDDMGCIDEFGHNKLAFLPAECIIVEYSTDGGSTWVDYGLTDAQKVALVTTTGPSVGAGKNTTVTAENIANLRCRVRIACGTMAKVGKIYTATKKFLINVSTSGAGNTKVKIRRRTIANYLASTETWTDVGTYDVYGWSGWNSIPYTAGLGGSMTTQTGQVGQIEFEFWGETFNSSYASRLTVMDFRLIGSTNWTMPSELARAGHLYTMDTSQNATFPAKVTAPMIETGTGANNYFQSQKFRGQGDAAVYQHAIDFGYAGHNQVDFYEYGGVWNFWKNTGSTATTDTANLALGIGIDALKNKSYTYTFPNKTGTFALTSDIPSVPTVNNGTLTIQKNGSNVATFTANQSGNSTANIVVPTKTSDITNDSNFPVDASYVHTDNNYTTTEKNKLSGIASGAEVNVQSDWSVTDSSSDAFIKNKPTIPTVNNATLTIQKNGSTVNTFTANASSNVTANITVPTKTSDITNDSNFITDANAQKFAIGQGSTQPVFDDMTPIQTIEWDVSDTTYRPIYQFENTGWTYTNMDITVAYRVTVTGTNINSVTDVVDRWFNPVSWPLTSALMKTQSTTAATTGLRYLRAVYPTSGYLNNNTYKFGMELEMYNTTARHVKVEVFKTNSVVTWNSTKPSGSIYQGNSTYQSTNSIEAYATRGWRFRQPVQMYAPNAGYASYISDFEAVNTSAGELKSGATALVGGHFAFLADDGLVYDISNTAKNISMGEAKIGFINGAVSANTAIGWTVWRAISRPNATQLGYFNHDTFVLGDRVYLRCTMDSNGNVHSGNYLSKTMSAGYTWMPFGWARSATTLYVDTRFPVFYTLDSNGKLSHINGKELAGSGGASYVAGNHIDITNDVISAEDYVHSEDPVSTGSITPVVTNGMVANGTLTASKFASGELLTLTMSTTDIGEGAALAANTLYGVYD